MACSLETNMPRQMSPKDMKKKRKEKRRKNKREKFSEDICYCWHGDATHMKKKLIKINKI